MPDREGNGSAIRDYHVWLQSSSSKNNTKTNAARFTQITSGNGQNYKSIARSYLLWPNMSEYIESFMFFMCINTTIPRKAKLISVNCFYKWDMLMERTA